MSVTIDGKVYRNMQEQVKKNKDDIAEYITIEDGTTISKDTIFEKTIDVKGATTLEGATAVTGVLSANGSISTTGITASEDITSAGKITGGTLEIGGNAEIDGNIECNADLQADNMTILGGNFILNNPDIGDFNIGKHPSINAFLINADNSIFVTTDTQFNLLVTNDFYFGSMDGANIYQQGTILIFANGTRYNFDNSITINDVPVYATTSGVATINTAKFTGQEENTITKNNKMTSVCISVLANSAIAVGDLIATIPAALNQSLTYGVIFPMLNPQSNAVLYCKLYDNMIYSLSALAANDLITLSFVIAGA